MTSPHGSSEDRRSADLAVYDLHPAAPQAALPLALGQLLLAVGIALILFGLWTFASTTLEPQTGTRATPNSQPSASSGGGDDAAPDVNTGNDTEEARFDCNEDRTVCRFTAPNGAETYVCVEPCDLPTWSGDGVPVIGLAEGNGIDGAEFKVGDDGTLELLPTDHNEASHFQFVDDGSGGIELQIVGEEGDVRVRVGDLESPTVDAQANGDSATTDSASGSVAEGSDSGGGAGRGALPLPGIAPILILLGVAFAIVAAVIIRQARRNRSDSDDDGDVHHQDVHHQEVLEELGEPEENPAVAAAEVRVRKISDLISELQQDGDPARAIQRAYAALETGFGNPTLARRPSETCSTYLHRTIGVVGGVSEPLRRLTTLFELARFSDTVIDEQMRTDAIASLSMVRDAWRARGGLARTS